MTSPTDNGLTYKEIRLADGSYTINGGVVPTDALIPWDDITWNSMGDKAAKLKFLRDRYPFMLNDLLFYDNGEIANAPSGTCERYTGVSSRHIVEHFFEFLEMIKHKFPYIHIGVTHDPVSDHDFNGGASYPTAYLYTPYSPYTLARVGFGTFRESLEGVPKYTIWTPYVYNINHAVKIRNRAISGFLDKTINNIRRYMRSPLPHTFPSIVCRFVVSAHRNAIEECEEIRLTARRAIEDREKNGKAVWFEELLRVHAHQREYEGVQAPPYQLNPALYDDITEYFNVTAEAQERLDCVKSSLYQVHISRHGGSVFYDVTEIDVPEIEDGYRYISSVNVGDTKRYTANDVPEDIVGKISVLQVNHTQMRRSNSIYDQLQDREFMLGVGFTASEGRLYYVVA